jgi:TonB family protein
MKEIAELDWTPGVESEPLPNLRLKSVALAVLSSFGLFCLLPLSEFVRPEEWIVRPAEVPTYTPPPPPATEMEKEVVKKLDLPAPTLETSPVQLLNELSAATLEVGPGDFKAAFSLATFNPIPTGFASELVFSMHELDRNPAVVKRGSLIYPAHLRRKGLEGEVKLLVQINEKGRVKVLETVSSTHPDFVEASRKAAEGSVYEPPTRNGKPVKVEFYLPVRFSMLK